MVAIIRNTRVETARNPGPPISNYVPRQPTAKGREYRARIPYSFSFRHIGLQCRYKTAGVHVRWKMEPRQPIYLGCASGEQVIDCVIEVFDCDRAAIVSPRRHVRIMRPRQAVYFLMKEFTPLSYPQIGELIGGRDHTTVLHGVRQAALLYGNNDDFMDKIEQCRTRLRSALVGEK